eukprot:767108-Hanusia_phi.AAC.10
MFPREWWDSWGSGCAVHPLTRFKGWFRLTVGWGGQTRFTRANYRWFPRKISRIQDTFEKAWRDSCSQLLYRNVTTRIPVPGWADSARSPPAAASSSSSSPHALTPSHGPVPHVTAHPAGRFQQTLVEVSRAARHACVCTLRICPSSNLPSSLCPSCITASITAAVASAPSSFCRNCALCVTRSLLRDSHPSSCARAIAERSEDAKGVSCRGIELKKMAQSAAGRSFSSFPMRAHCGPCFLYACSRLCRSLSDHRGPGPAPSWHV